MGRRIAAVVAIAVAAASCGSPGHRSRAASSSAGTSTTLVSAALGGPSGLPAQAGSPAGSSARPGSPAPGGAVAPGGGQVAAGRGTGGAVGITPANQAGVSATEIRIGVPVINDYSTIGSFGAKIASPSAADIERSLSAAINDVNANGGMAGRKVVPVYQPVNYLTGGSFESQSQSMCEYFTTDHKVFAVVMAVNNHSTLLPACLAQRNTVMVDTGNSVYFDDTAMAGFASSYYRPTALSLGLYGHYIDELVGQGLLGKSNRIGLLRYDLPQQQRVDAQVLRPTLAAHGLRFADEIAFSYLNQASDLSDVGAQSNNAILRFRSEGIDRVVLLASEGPIPFTFMPSAESQGYRPEYGLTSTDLPGFLSNNVPAAQLHGARGVGWSRLDDLNSQRWPDSPVWQHCAAVMAKAGFSEPLYGFACDPFLFLKAALDRATVVSPAGMRAAVDGLGQQFVAAGTFVEQFGPGRTSGVAAIRDLSFDDSCKCFKYSSAPKPAG